MDPLSDILSLLKPHGYMAGGFDAAGPWSVQFPRHDGIKFYSVVSGQCWLSIEGAEAVRLRAGDCLLLPRGLPFRLASDLALTPVDALSVITTAPQGGITTLNGGGDYFGFGGYFAFAGDHAEMLLGVLPPVVHIRKDSDKTALRSSLEQMINELRDPQPGSFLVAQHLAQLLLIQGLRLHLAQGASGGVGWLFALADKQMSAAITAMHRDPSRSWTLQALAEEAGMSRSSFALKFKETVGATAMDYLARWRMLVAGERLTRSREPISTIALSLGYESESAFSTAFKRVMACSPRQYGRSRNPSFASRGENRDAGLVHSHA